VVGVDGDRTTAECDYWALGEAIVDAVVTRYPVAFDGGAIVDVG
jgi:hypothetical protein